MPTLHIQNLSKTYPNGVKAMDDVNLTINHGMFGLLGPNGAGKSTLMRTLATLQESDAGTFQLDGIDGVKEPDRIRQALGYLPQEFGVYPGISAFDLLDHVAILKGVQSKKERVEMVDHLLQRVNLYEQRKKKVKSFSGGMKQRIGIAQSLIGNPKLIIVDEPTAGLDPAERNRFHNILADLGRETIVILSTHIVDDVKELCTHMAIMNLGKVVFNGTPSQAVSELEGKVWQREIERHELQEYMHSHTLISSRMMGGSLVVHALQESEPVGFTPVVPDLEDVFFTKTSSHAQELV